VSEAIAWWHRHRGNHLRGVKVVVCLSRYVAEVCERYGVPASALRVIPPPLGTTVAENDSLSGGRTGVAFIGRWEAYKGERQVIALAQALPETPFTIMGGGPLHNELLRAVDQAKNIHLLGWVTQERAREVLQQSLIALVPSQWAEPFGLVALEAQAAGAIALVSDRGGLPEVIEDGRTGYVLPAENTTAWAQKIRELQASPQKCARLSAAAQERAATLGNPEVFLATMLDIYSEVCQSAPERSALRSM
jgi:glycosyltransferase involved in cell wall biosynthesis